MTPPSSTTQWIKEIGPGVPGESGFRRRARFHQAWYRATVLGLPRFGQLEGEPPRPVGSVLSEADGSEGRNFICTEARQLYAHRRTEGWGVEPERCTRYMTSSQALTINLFGAFNQDLPWLLRTLQAVLNRSDLYVIYEVRVEYAPKRPSEHLGDKTRLDVLCSVGTPQGLELIVFEIKYLDRFNSRWIDLRDRKPYQSLFRNTLLWRTSEGLYQRQVNQLVRCHALAASIALKANTEHTPRAPSLVVLHHPLDPGVAKIGETYASLLTQPDSFRTLTLSRWISAMAGQAITARQAELARRLMLRYASEDASDTAWTAAASRSVPGMSSRNLAKP